MYLLFIYCFFVFLCMKQLCFLAYVSNPPYFSSKSPPITLLILVHCKNVKIYNSKTKIIGVYFMRKGYFSLKIVLKFN